MQQNEEQNVYQKPTLKRFGSFRELTRLGFNNVGDGASIMAVNANGVSGAGNDICKEWRPGCGKAPSGVASTS